MKNKPDENMVRGATPKTKPRSVTNKRTKRTQEEERIYIEHVKAGGTHLIPQRIEQLGVQVEELRERFLYLIETWAADRYRYEWLENHTGISAARWQHVSLEKQLPTLEMLIAVRNALPGEFYWLMFGTTPTLDDPLLSTKLRSPSEEAFNAFRAHREWIKQKRKAKTAAR